MNAPNNRSVVRAAILVGCFAALLVAGGCAKSSPEATSKQGIVTFAPNLTEIVFALGQGDRVVGVSSFCNYPPEVLSDRYAKVGGQFNPDLEKLAVLSPELVLLEGEHAKVAEFCRLNGIKYVNLPIDSLQTLDQGIQTIGDLLGCPEKAKALRTEIASGLDAVRTAVHDLPRPKVLIISARSEHDLNNVFTVGGTSFISEIVRLAGGDNIFQDESKPYFEASKESVVLKAPEVILEFHAGEQLTPEQQSAYIADWDELPSLPAVQHKRVYLVMDDYALIPGPRVVLTARRVASLLHPDAGVQAP